MKLENKVAIVTGGSRGIGRAISLAFANERAKVVVVSRNIKHCDEVVAQINQKGGDAIRIQADVSSEKDVTNMVELAKAKYQRIDILVNNAAVNLPYRTVTELTTDEWNWIIGVNLTGIFLCCRAVLPQMIEQKSGKIINFSSLGGRIGAAGRTPYRSSKAAVIMFNSCLAAEVKEHGIDVNTICPGAVDTDMLRDITGGEIPRHAMPSEQIADIAVFLASDESRAITGTAIDAYGTGNPLFGVSPSVRRPKRVE
jgi:NAD(P)-dependent dehydrogenase (short-subunit alcohol dehydrogenase family)